MLKVKTNLNKNQCKVEMKGNASDVLSEIAFTLFDKIIPNIEANNKELAKMLVERIEKLSKEYLKGIK